jgi:hypothetical protein
LCKSALGKGCRRFRRCARNSKPEKSERKFDYVVDQEKQSGSEAKMEARRERQQGFGDGNERRKIREVMKRCKDEKKRVEHGSKKQMERAYG